MVAMAEVLFDAASLLGEASDEEGGFGGGMHAFTSVDSYLPYVACSIRRDGWLSRGAAYKTGTEGSATADLALRYGVFGKPVDGDRRLEPSEKDFNLAAAIVHPKFVGIIASAIQFYQKDLEKRARAESWSKLVAGSEFQGTVGERQVFENLKVMSYRTWESNFGVTHFYSFLGEKGLVTYFASRDMDLSVGQVVSLKATVKKHEVYAGKNGGAPVNQTVITRAALVTRATVKSSDSKTVEETSVKVGPHYVKDGQKFNYYVTDAAFVEAVMETKKVTYHSYHFETVDGRKFVLTSKSKKKGLVAGVEALVEYSTEDLSSLNGGERPVSLVK
jgi:hypothetical protein